MESVDCIDGILNAISKPEGGAGMRSFSNATITQRKEDVMKVRKEGTVRMKPLLVAICAALALEFAGCKGGTDGSATTETGAGATGSATNSAATNASATADTNSSTASTSQ
jgi:hypothetical protein